MAVPPEAGSTCVPTPPLDSTPTCWVLGYGSVLLGTWLLELTRQWEVNMFTAGDGERCGEGWQVKQEGDGGRLHLTCHGILPPHGRHC